MACGEGNFIGWSAPGRTGPAEIFLQQKLHTGQRATLWCNAAPRHARRRRPRLEQLPPADRAGGRRPDLPARLGARGGAPGAGLTAEKRIDRATQARALDTLAKFAERLRGFSRQAVRVVGTNALRVAKNSPQFLREARAALGFPIEVISGREKRASSTSASRTPCRPRR